MTTLTLGNEAAERSDTPMGQEQYGKAFDVRDVGYCATQLAYVNRYGVAAPIGRIAFEKPQPVVNLGPENYIG